METYIEHFIRDFADEIVNDNAALFAGAGFSKESGYVDWKGLLRDVADEMNLNIDREDDLISVAQYYVNGNGRAGINRIIGNEFLQDKAPGENHKIVARMPIQSYWTTNYDSLLEDALKNEGKTVDIKYCNSHLSRTVPNRNVIIYKMHGDKSLPSEAVLIKDDYERYYKKQAPFVTALCGELVAKTFLFIGFSFSDPNLDYILSRMRVEYGEDVKKQHYALFREVTRDDYKDDDDYQYNFNKQKLFFDDLRKRYSIRPIIVKEYSEITEILKRIEDRINIKSIFISGSANEYGDTWGKQEATEFIETLSGKLIENGFNIVSGFGLGVGSSVISGVLKQIYMNEKKIDDKRLLLRPFPQGIVDDNTRKILWTKYREDMISHAGISIFMFGNKKDASGNIVNANGMREEFEISKTQGKVIIPLGCTGYEAQLIWCEVSKHYKEYYKIEDDELEKMFNKLNEKESIDDICNNVINVIKYLLKRG